MLLQDSKTWNRGASTWYPQSFANWTEERLLQRVAGGDGPALGEIYTRYSRLVFSVAYKVLGDRANAEEIVQEVFTKVWRSAREFDPKRGRFSAWLIGITQNRCIDELRRRQARVQLEPLDDESASSPAAEGNPAEALDHALERARVTRALAQIPVEQRTVIELAYFEGLTHPEIAARSGDPIGTVKTRLRLGMKKLRGLLED